MKPKLPNSRCYRAVLLLAGIALVTPIQSSWAEEVAASPDPHSSQPVSQTDAINNLLKPLSEISLETQQLGKTVPKDRFVTSLLIYQEHFSCDTCLKNYQWVAPGLNHNPLYTEDVALERYGWSYCPVLQPVVSGVRFCKDAATLPYQIGLDCPCELKSTLGYQRPGTWASRVVKRLPWSWKGAALQAGAVAGGIAFFH